MVHVGPFLLQTLFAEDTLGTVFPKKVFCNVRFVSVGDAAAVTQVVQFVLPNVI